MPVTDQNSKQKHPIQEMSLGDHLEELRTRLILALIGIGVGFALCLFFGKDIVEFIKIPYTTVVGEDATLTTLAPAEIIVSYIKIILLSGLIVSSPWVFYQTWMFIAAGLYPHEKRYVNLAAPFSALLFITGSLFFIFLVAPLCLQFFIKFHKTLDFSYTWSFQNYVSFITRLMLVFGLAFQTPIAIFFLNKTGLVSRAALSRSRKYVTLVIVIVAAIATPPDVVSQIALAIPLYILFEVGILSCHFTGKKK